MQSEEEVAKTALVGNILNVLCLLSSHLKIYPQGNEVVRVATSRLMLQLEKYFAGADHLDLIVARHGFLWGDLFVNRASVVLQKFANLIFMHGVAAIKVHSGVSEYEITTFLRLVGRKPAESWDEGGLRGALKERRIDNIEVVELSEKDFLLSDEATLATASGGVANQADLWNRFALGVFQRQQDNAVAMPPAEELDPEALAGATSAFLAEQSNEVRQRYMREVSSYLVSLQHENIRIYRAQALGKLARYINHLSPQLKRLFLQNVFNYNLKAEFSEDFFSNLSDELIMEALENAASGKNYIPPVVVNLLGKLARSRELLPADSPLLNDAGKGELKEKTRELFRSDEFEKFVPEKYRRALLQILGSDEIDGGFKEELSRLKATLQEEKLEEHTGQIILHILSHDADERHFGGLFDNLKKTLELYATTGHYPAIQAILARCDAQGDTAGPSLRKILESRPFIERLLGGANCFGKEKHEALRQLIEAVGAPCIDPLLDRLALEKNRAIRFFFIQCLKGLGATVAVRAGQRLGDQRWYYLRNLLVLLREVGTPAISGVIRPLFRHPHPKVRHEALKTGLIFHDEMAERLLLELLNSRESSVVVAAIALAPLAQNARIFTGLSALLDRNELFSYQLEVKRGVVTALIEIDQRQALPVLQRCLDRRNVVHPFLHAELSRDIIKRLEGFEPSQVAQLLHQLSASRDAEQARTATEILARMQGGKS